MFCRKCGKSLPDNSAFCASCGAATAAQPSNPIVESAPDSSNSSAASQPTSISATSADMPVSSYTQRKKSKAAFIFAAVSVLLATALMFSFLGILPSPFGASAATSAPAIVSQDFETPEEAIRSFVEYLKSGDYNGALSTCAIEKMSAGFNYRRFAEHLFAITPYTISGVPSEYPQYVQANVIKNTGTIMMQMIDFTLSFGLTEDYSSLLEGESILIQDGKFPEDLIKEMDPANISSLDIVEINQSAKCNLVYSIDKQQERAAIYGADNIKYKSVLYELNGKYYVGGFTLIEYDDRWQVFSMNDPLIVISKYGTPIEISDKSEFQDMLGY